MLSRKSIMQNRSIADRNTILFPAIGNNLEILGLKDGKYM